MEAKPPQGKRDLPRIKRQPLTVYLSPALARRVEAYSAGRGISASAALSCLVAQGLVIEERKVPQ